MRGTEQSTILAMGKSCEASRLAAGLLKLGLHPGDRMGIWGSNSTEWYICRLAAAKAGLIAVQIDPAYQAPQLLHSITKVDIKVLIYSEFYKNNSCYHIVSAVIPELTSCPKYGIEINSANVPSVKRLVIMSNTQYNGTYRLSDIIESASTNYMKMVEDLQKKIQADDGCAIQFSSGTTGTPKGVLLSHHNLVNNALLLGRRFEMLAEGNKMLVATQFCHTAGSLGCIICGLCHGFTCVVPVPVFNGRKMLEGIIKESCTHTIATPSLYVDMITALHDMNVEVTSLQVASYVGAPCSHQLAMQIKETFNVRKLMPAYGMTEISVVFCSQQDDSLEQTVVTVGYVADHCEVKVVDKEGKIVPMGTPGELWVRGYNVMLGYWKDEEKTKSFIGPDRWAKTGDQFVLQEDGYGRIVGRVKDVIIRIGDKIFPKEIEDFFTSHPHILEAQAFGIPDPKVGEEICVYIRLREGTTLTEQNIRNYCRDKIPEYRIPRYIRFVKEFERTAIGKVQKFRLLESLQKELNQ